MLHHPCCVCRWVGSLVGDSWPRTFLAYAAAQSTTTLAPEVRWLVIQSVEGMVMIIMMIMITLIDDDDDDDDDDADADAGGGGGGGGGGGHE